MSCWALYLPPGIITSRCPSARHLFISFQALCFPVSRWPKLVPSQEQPNSSQCSTVLPFPFRKPSGQTGATPRSQVPPQPSTSSRPAAASVAQTTCPTAPRSPDRQPMCPCLLAADSGRHSSMLSLSTAQSKLVMPQGLCSPARRASQRPPSLAVGSSHVRSSVMPSTGSSAHN